MEEDLPCPEAVAEGVVEEAACWSRDIVVEGIVEAVVFLLGLRANARYPKSCCCRAWDEG